MPMFCQLFSISAHSRTEETSAFLFYKPELSHCDKGQCAQMGLDLSAGHSLSEQTSPVPLLQTGQMLLSPAHHHRSRCQWNQGTDPKRPDSPSHWKRRSPCPSSPGFSVGLCSNPVLQWIIPTVIYLPQPGW